MTYFAEDSIRRLPDSSIDTRYYLAKCHRQRSELAHELTGKLASASQKLLDGAARTTRSLLFFM